MIIADFLNLKEIPSFNEFEIDELINYYKTYLCSYDFVYECNDTDNPTDKININLTFLPENFVHLVSLDKVVNKKYPLKTIIKNLETNIWTKKDLKNFNPKTFRIAKKRMKLLTMVYQILKNPEVISFNPDLVVPDTQILSKFLITDIYSNQYIHLGIDGPNDTDNKYFPRTLLGENTDKFINNQKFYKVLKADIIKKS